jgi:hypothetical protein
MSPDATIVPVTARGAPVPPYVAPVELPMLILHVVYKFVALLDHPDPPLVNKVPPTLKFPEQLTSPVTSRANWGNCFPPTPILPDPHTPRGAVAPVHPIEK